MRIKELGSVFLCPCTYLQKPEHGTMCLTSSPLPPPFVREGVCVHTSCGGQKTVHQWLPGMYSRHQASQQVIAHLAIFLAFLL